MEFSVGIDSAYSIEQILFFIYLENVGFLETNFKCVTTSYTIDIVYT